MRKEVSLVRKKIDTVNKELKPLGHTCQKKVRHAINVNFTTILIYCSINSSMFLRDLGF
jgi:hypothetical protein